MRAPTKFEIMRRNRATLERAASAWEAEQAWLAERRRFLDERTESFEDTRDWLADTAKQASAAPAAAGAIALLDDTLPPRRRWWPFTRRAG